MQADQTTVNQQQQVGDEFQPAQELYQVQQGYSDVQQSPMYQQVGVDQQQSGGELFQDAEQDATYVDQQQQAGGQDQAYQSFPGAEQSQYSQQSQEDGQWSLSESVQEFLDELPVDESAQIHAPQQQPSEEAIYYDLNASDHNVGFFAQIDRWGASAGGNASQQQALQDNQQPGELWDVQAQEFDDQSHFNEALPYDEAQGDVE